MKRLAWFLLFPGEGIEIYASQTLTKKHFKFKLYLRYLIV